MGTTRIRTVRPLTDPEYDALTLARTNLLGAPNAASRAYYAIALYKTTPVAAEGLRTWAVDASWRMYIDPDYLPGGSAGWSAADCADVIEHELGHLLRAHSERMDAHGGINHDRERANTACDCEINDDTAEGSFVRKIGVLPKQYGMKDNETAEWYYDRLTSMALPLTGSGDGSGGQGQPGSAGAQGTGGTGAQGHGGTSPTPCGSGAGNPIDGELPADQDGGFGADPLSAGDAELARRSVAIAVKEHVARHGRGSVPGGIEQWADVTLTPPKVPWQQLFRSAIRHGMSRARGASDYTYSRLSRRSTPGSNIILPGTFSPQVTVDTIVDVSGSMSDQMVFEALSEVEGVARAAEIRGNNLRLIQVDAAVGSIQPVWSLSRVKLTGRGGTDLRVGLAVSDNMQPRASVQIVLTDGDGPIPGPSEAPPRGVQQVWVLVHPRDRTTAERFRRDMPWAEVVVVE